MRSFLSGPGRRKLLTGVHQVIGGPIDLAVWNLPISSTLTLSDCFYRKEQLMDKKEPQESVSKKGKGIGEWIKSLFLNPYAVGIVLVIFAVLVTTWCEQHNQAQDQKRAAMEMLESIAIEMDFNVKQTDGIIYVLKEACQDSLFISVDLSLATGAYQAALTAGELRYIPRYAYAIIMEYDGMEIINKRLDRIRDYLLLPSHRIRSEDLSRYVNHTITQLEKKKESMSKHKKLIKTFRSEIVNGEIRVEPIIEEKKEGPWSWILSFAIKIKDKRLFEEFEERIQGGRP